MTTLTTTTPLHTHSQRRAFFAAYLATQYVSLGSVLGCIGFGVGCVFWHHDNLFVMISGILVAALTVFMHRGNNVRLLKGAERKTNLFKK